jgi:hypothetical protein
MSRAPQPPSLETAELRAAPPPTGHESLQAASAGAAQGTPPFDEERAMLRLEVAAYIAQMSSELGTMAKGADLTLLSYFLEMAAAEARESSANLARMTGLPAPLAQQADQART